MSKQTISIKPANHNIYQCPESKKIALIERLITENASLDTVVVCSSDAEALSASLADADVRVIEDREMVKAKELTCEFLISYDMPIKAIVYMARVAKATKKAVMLLDESEQRDVHAIETLYGRAIKQIALEGFMYPVVAKPEVDERRKKPLTKEQISEIAKKRHEDATKEKKESPKKNFEKPKKSFDKPKDDRWAKKKKAPNKFLGKDENGKAIFSGKSGERNHRYDGTPREKYDAPKKVGKKINIKVRKPKEEK